MRPFRLGSTTPGRRPTAFTLIELLTVLAIIAILAAVAVPVVSSLKPNVTAAATRQLLDDVARARQFAISQRTTVYMVFVPTNFWNDPAYTATVGSWSQADLTRANKLLDKQLIAYNFVSLRSLGDQPGRGNPQYLASWKTLPDGAFIPLPKFWQRNPNNPALNIYTNGNVAPAYRIYGFATTNNIPFPSETTPPRIVGGVRTWVTLPYIAFDYTGQVVHGPNEPYGCELIPLAKGAVGFSRNANKIPLQALPSITEQPAGNSTNAYNLVKVEWLTGRARVERLEIQ